MGPGWEVVVVRPPFDGPGIPAVPSRLGNGDFRPSTGLGGPPTFAGEHATIPGRSDAAPDSAR